MILCIGEQDCQRLALLTRSLGQRKPGAARYIHRTRKGASSGSYLPDEKYAPRLPELSIELQKIYDSCHSVFNRHDRFGKLMSCERLRSAFKIIPRVPATARWSISPSSSPSHRPPRGRCRLRKTDTVSASQARDICCACDKACRHRAADRCR